MVRRTSLARKAVLQRHAKCWSFLVSVLFIVLEIEHVVRLMTLEGASSSHAAVCKAMMHMTLHVAMLRIIAMAGSVAKSPCTMVGST